MILLQEAKCPTCRVTWDLENKFVEAGDTIACKNGCAPFSATSDTVMCCLEDAHGMLQMPLRGL
jgi:hypothetical protein